MQYSMPRNTKLFAVTVCLGFLFFGVKANAQFDDGSGDDSAHIRVGDRMPAISVHETSSDTFSTAAEKGKVVVVSFWATWCVPCQMEMPRLEKDIWGKYKSSPDFAMVAIAPEQSKETVSGFQQKHHEYTYPLAYDPDRSAFGLFADGGIPRTYVADRQGKIVFQSVGYSPEDVADLDEAIQKALKAK